MVFINWLKIERIIRSICINIFCLFVKIEIIINNLQ